VSETASPVLSRGLDSLLASRAAQAPEAIAAIFPGRRLTYARLERLATDMARRLLALGVGPGDRVGIMLPDATPEYVALLFGAAKLNAIAVAVNARYKEHELRYLVGHAGLRVLVADARLRGVVHAADVERTCPVVAPTGDLRFEAGLAVADDAAVAAAQAKIAGDEPALMLYTSGTTANPKGCLHGHRGLLAQAENFATRLELTATDRFWTPLPLFHIGGITVLLASLHARIPFVHVGFFEAGAALEQLAAERCTVAFPAFETIWLAVLDHPRFAASDLSALRTIVAIGIEERLRQMQARVPWAKQVSATGSTESGGFLCLGAAGDPLDARMATAGRPVPGMEVRVVDPETGEDVPAGTPGELIFRGVSRFIRYHEDPEATAAAIDADGWFHSGDIARADERGFVAYVGRYKDMLKVGGENVAAAEVENFLATHPAVQVVQVVAAPDARYGEVAAAFVQLKDGAHATEQELIDHCRGRISTFKVPRYVRFVDEWPLAGNKIRKHELRERIADELARAGITMAPKLTS
jgi:fatty-acyl-CoA synthase